MSERLPKGFDTPVRIGEGGFASAYRARQTRLERHVVVKLIRISDTQQSESLCREARMHADIDLPFTPRIYDVFRYRKSLCIVMEWIRSVDLRRFLNTNPPFHHRLTVATSLIETTAAFHARGFAHCDLKPTNVLLSPESGAYLIDFGLSRRGNERKAETRGKTAAGTPRYCAPELFDASREIHDYRPADLYALGILLEDILGPGRPVELVDRLTAETPETRPRDAEEVRRLWVKDFGGPSAAAWSEICGPTTASVTANLLVTGASKLLQEGRFDEAYRLALEALSEVPDHPRGLALVQSFHSRVAARKKRSILVRAGIAAGVIAALSVSATLYLRGPDRLTSAVMANSPSGRVTAPPPLAPSPNYEGEYNGRYRLGIQEMKTLTATIDLRVPNPHARVFLDGIAVGEFPHPRKPVRLAVGGGLHRLSCMYPDGSVWTSHVRLAPFQKVKVSIPDSDGKDPHG
ncbi:MAG: protein kinase [Chitinivibrionales bacterium]|nr:protein kinase [Chitinivibrionales bacterium]MBD3355635.1 protein kinase [Chitinivibrionales bacterium]